MLVFWSNESKDKLLKAVGHVFQSYPGTPWKHVSDLSQIPAGPDVQAIVCFGAETLEKLVALGLVHKGRTINSLRGVPVALPETTSKAFITYSPNIGQVDHAKYVQMVIDVMQAMRYVATGSLEPDLSNVDYQYVSDLKSVRKDIEGMLETTTGLIPVGLDTETLGLDEFNPSAYIVSIQVSYKPGLARVIHFKSQAVEQEWIHTLDNVADLAWLLNEPRLSLRGANLKYDLRWIHRRLGLECTNFRFDTTIVGSLLDENRSNGLDVHAKLYTPMGGYSDTFDRTVDKSRMDLLPPDDKFLVYAGGDADATLRVSEVEKNLLAAESKPLFRFYVNLLHPAARTFEIVERGGIFVDREEFRKLDADLEADMLRLTKEAKSMLGGQIVAKHLDDSKTGGLNLTKASLLEDFLFSPMGLNLKPQELTAKTKKPSTSLDHLMKFSSHPVAGPFVKLLSEFSSTQKTRSTYVTGFLHHLRSDGRFHPHYYLFVGSKEDNEGGTNTGRLSCRDPAWQTVPKHTKWAKRIRRCYPAPPGMLVVERDFSQGELKIIACLANEENMIRAYLNNMDLHVMTSGRFRGYTYEDMMALKVSDPDLFDAIRQLGKAGNFGLIYGMGEEGFEIYAETNYGVKLIPGEAGKFRDGFFQDYPGLLTYHKEYKAFARKNGYVMSPLGRVRHLPLINSFSQQERSKEERRAVNAPVQSALSDMLVLAMSLSVKQGWHYQMPPMGAVHDAAYNYVLEDDYLTYVKREVELMENLPLHEFGWKPRLQFTADAKVGPNMADLKKVAFH